MILEDARDHGAIRKSMAAGTHNLAIVPKALELCSIRPMERPVALELAVMELTFKPGAIWQALCPLALDAIVLEVTRVLRAVGPSQDTLTFSYAILPITGICNPIRPPHLATAIHAILLPLARIDP